MTALAVGGHPEKRPMSAHEKRDVVALRVHLDHDVPPAARGSAHVAEVAAAMASDSDQIAVFIVSAEPEPDFRTEDYGDLSPSLAAGLAFRAQYADMRAGGRCAPAQYRATMIRALVAERFQLTPRSAE